METAPGNAALSVREILFANGHKARLAAAPPGASADELLRALGLQTPKALLIIIGGAAGLDEAPQTRLAQLFSRGLARAASETGALIMDGGTQSGVMAMMGQGVADRGRKSILLGVAPAGKVSYPGGPKLDSLKDGASLEPNHSHFVLAEAPEWGGEMETLFSLAAALAKGIRVVTVLVNGGPITKSELLRNVRQGWPVILVEGTGRLADDVADALKKPAAFIPDPVLAEIVADGEFHSFPIDGSVEGLERLVTRVLSGNGTLQQAWERFAVLDDNARRQQRNFLHKQNWILFLGLAGTALALTQKQWGLEPDTDPTTPATPNTPAKILHWVIVIIPITTTVLIAAANRFKDGSKWLLLRACAESIKRDIFRYRTRAGAYSKARTQRISREARLAKGVEDISRRLMQTEVNISALRPYEGAIPPKMGGATKDDGLSVLSPDQYVAIRVADQISYYCRKTNQLERQLRWLHWGIYVIGGLGTFLAAINFELWIALTGTVVASLTSYLGYRQVENSLLQYNQAMTNLENVRGWWTALAPEEQTRQKNVDALVEHTEKILQGELAGWVQQMTDALADLRAQQTGQGSGSDEEVPEGGDKEPATKTASTDTE